MREKLFRIHWRVIPIALVLFLGLLFGAQSGAKALGYVSFIRRDYSDALQNYAAANDDAGQGMVYLALDMPDEAIQHFKNIHDESGLGYAYAKKRDYTTAIMHFQAAGDNSGMGYAYLGLRDEANAQKNCEAVNDSAGLGFLQLQKKNYAKAAQYFSKIDDQSGLGLVAVKTKKFDQAATFFYSAKDKKGLGLLAMVKRDYDQAVQHFLEANDSVGLGYAYMASGNFQKALQRFQEVHDLNGLGDLNFRLNRFAQARDRFESDHNPAKVIQSFRMDSSLPDRLQQAIAYGQKAVAANNHNNHAPECLLEMGDIYYELGQTDKALTTLDQAASFPGYASDAHLLKGRIYFYLRDFQMAKAEFEQVKPDDLAGDEKYVQAQASLQTLGTYKKLNVQPAPSF